jgi:23S rRNA maturation mini-RNase III
MTGLFIHPLENSNHHQKIAEEVKALLESENRTVGKRGTNTNSNTRVFPRGKQ